MHNPVQIRARSLFHIIRDLALYKVASSYNLISDYNTFKMKRLTINIEIEDFWFNFFELKNSFSLPLPIDNVTYKCSECEEELVLFPNGEYYCSSDFTSFEDLIETEKDKLTKSHNDNCMKPVLTLHPDFGVPDNLLFLVQSANQEVLKPFKIEGIKFSPILLVSKDDVAALVIFKSNNAQQDTYSQLILQNFETHLNIPNPKSSTNESNADDNKVTIDDINDEDELHENQQQLPRLLGGGRSFLQEVKYVCQWCTHEQLQKPTRGRFREIKNYRDHFRNYHSDIPFNEFLNKVERQEPKWQCKICRQKMSLANQLRHQVICRPKKYETSSDSDSDDDQNERSSESSKSNYNEEKQSDKSDEEEVKPRGKIRKRAISSSDSSSHEDEEEIVNSVVKKVVKKITKYNIMNKVMEALENEPSCSNHSDGEKKGISSMSEENQLNDEILSDDPYKFDDYNEDDNNENEKQVMQEKNVSDKSPKSNILQGDEFMKWWQGIPRNVYYKVEGCPLEIFMKTDSEDFIKEVIEKYKSHTELKAELDRKNKECEREINDRDGR